MRTLIPLEKVLALWAATDLTIKEIAERLHFDRSGVSKAISRARDAKEPKAVVGDERRSAPQ